MQKFFLKPFLKKKKINEIRGVFSEIAGFTMVRNEHIYNTIFHQLFYDAKKLLKKMLKKMKKGLKIYPKNVKISSLKSLN